MALLATLGLADGFYLERGVLTTPVATLPPAAVPVPKHVGPDVLPLLEELGFDAQVEREEFFLEQVAAADVPVTYRTLVADDRVGALGWIETPAAKAAFRTLKERLVATLSKKVEKLVDETTQNEGEPVVNRLSFTDPAIGPDTFLFLRVRERLYELHIAPGQDEAFAPLIQALVAR